MKFQMLAMGDRFEFDGQVYVKTGPLTAMGERGGQRMIPRYAVFRPLAGAAATPAWAPALAAELEAARAACLAALTAADVRD